MSSLHKISVSAFFSFLCLALYGGNPYHPVAGAGEAGTGYVCIMKNSFWSSFHNQANLAGSKSLSLGLNYENRYGIKELGTRTAGITIPAGKTSLGAVYSYFGYPEFRKEMAGIACGLKLCTRITAGVQVDYFSEKTSGEYTDHRYLTCEAGFIITPSESLSMGIHVFNPVPESISRSGLPSILRVGVGNRLSKALFAGIETEMSTGSKLIIRTGFEYETLKMLWLRGGFSTDNTSFSFGIGFRMRLVKIDLGFATHEKLGVTSSASLIFQIK